MEWLGAQIQTGQLGFQHVGHGIVGALFNKVLEIVGGEARAIELFVDEAPIPRLQRIAGFHAQQQLAAAQRLRHPLLPQQGPLADVEQPLDDLPLPRWLQVVVAQARQVAEGAAQQQFDAVPAQLVPIEGVHIDLPFQAGEAQQEVAGEADPLHIQPYLATQLDDEDAKAHRDPLAPCQHLVQVAVGRREVILPVAAKP